MTYTNEFLRKKKPETFMDYNPGEIPKKKETTTKPLTLGEVAPKATERVTSRQTSDSVQTRDPFLKGFYSTENNLETERKTYLQHRETPSSQTKTAETPIRKTQNSNPYGSPVKIVGDNVTEKDYEDFWNAFRNEGTGSKLNWANNITKPQNTERRQYVTDGSRKMIQSEIDSSKVYEDDFRGQFGANYQESKMKQDADEARYKYYKNPTPENKKHFENLEIELDNFRKNNAEVLADDASLPLISQGLAKIAPEIVDNVKNNLMYPGALGAVVNAKDDLQDLELRFMDKHYTRNDNNGDVPQHISELPEGWYLEDADNCHQFGVPGRDNQKYVSSDGKREVIFDANGYIVTDDKNMGTYNYYGADTNAVGHVVADVIPWILWGNTPEDETTKLERMLGFPGIYIN